LGSRSVQSCHTSGPQGHGVLLAGMSWTKVPSPDVISLSLDHLL
jgi:hypothetical protein